MVKIKNWAKFQHFKDRRPPWVKLYRDILDDVEWFELDPKLAKILVMLWLIASEEEDGQLPDVKKLSFRLRLPEKEINAAIIGLSHWLDQDDTAPISAGYQDDLPERETETETETEKKQKAPRATRLPADWEPSQDDTAFCKAERPDLNVRVTVSRFKDYWAGAVNGTKKDWPATWRNWVRAERASGSTFSKNETTQDEMKKIIESKKRAKLEAANAALDAAWDKA